MADQSLVSTGSSSKSCCRYLELLGSGVKANPRLATPSGPSLFNTVRRLVRQKTSACLNSSILNEYTTELTKQFE